MKTFVRAFYVILAIGNILASCTNRSVTIDPLMQAQARILLREKVIETKADSGILAIMEVKTGEIKAMIKICQYSDSIKEFVDSSFLGHPQEPGSVFTPISLMAAMEETGLLMTDSVNTGKDRTEFGRMFNILDPKAEDPGFGKITIKEAVHLSSNIAITKTVLQSFDGNLISFRKRLLSMGAGQPYDGDTFKFSFPRRLTSMSVIAPIGYGFKMSPKQILCFYNAIANDGKMIKPQFENKVFSQPDVLNRRICNSKTLQSIQDALKYSFEPIALSGKSGFFLFRWGFAYNNSFCGYFPSDKPKYSVIASMYYNLREIPFNTESSSQLCSKIANGNYE